MAGQMKEETMSKEKTYMQSILDALGYLYRQQEAAVLLRSLIWAAAAAKRARRCRFSSVSGGKLTIWRIALRSNKAPPQLVLTSQDGIPAIISTDKMEEVKMASKRNQ